MILFENVRIIGLAPQSVSAPVDVAVEGGYIADVGERLAARYPGSKRESATPYVSAGLVCGHNHFYSALARGLTVAIAPSKDFVQMLSHLWWRLDRALDDEIVRWSGYAGAADAVMCGVTSVVDHHASPEHIDGSLSLLREGFERVGLRGVLCYETTDRNGAEGARAGVRENLRFAAEIDALRKSDASPDRGDGRFPAPPLVEAAIGAHAGFTIGEETLGAVAEAVRTSGRGLHIHAAEDHYDASDSRRRYGADLAVRLDRSGCLGPKSIIAHGLYLTEDEVELMNDRGAFLAHNARSNMNNGVGYNTLLPRYRNSILGTDGIGSDMMAEAGFAYFKHRDSGGPLWPPAFLSMLDRGNRLLERYFAAPGWPTGEPRFGQVLPGYAADLVFWDYDPPTPLSGENLAGHVMFGMSSRSVHSVLVGGQFLLRGRRPQFDANEIFAHSREQTARLWKRMEER
jgi:putative selenium metabolism protein SsnA